MACCAVAVCPNTQKNCKYSSVSFHRFPRCEDTRKLWALKCNRADDHFNVTNARVCSLHFVEEDYQRDLRNELLGLPLKKLLREDAVPSLFLTNDAEVDMKKARKKKVQSTPQKLCPVKEEEVLDIKEEFPDNLSCLSSKCSLDTPEYTLVAPECTSVNPDKVLRNHFPVIKVSPRRSRYKKRLVQKRARDTSKNLLPKERNSSSNDKVGRVLETLKRLSPKKKSSVSNDKETRAHDTKNLLLKKKQSVGNDKQTRVLETLKRLSSKKKRSVSNDKETRAHDTKKLSLKKKQSVGNDKETRAFEILNNLQQKKKSVPYNKNTRGREISNNLSQKKKTIVSNDKATDTDDLIDVNAILIENEHLKVKVKTLCTLLEKTIASKNAEILRLQEGHKACIKNIGKEHRNIFEES